MEGRIIEVLLDELGRTYAAFISQWRAWGMILPKTDIAEIAVVHRKDDEAPPIASAT
jgi:hypothetical protein